jgi:PAS domain S-box-containing protein
MEAVLKKERRAAYPLALIFVLLVVGIVTASCLYFAPMGERLWQVAVTICVLLFGSGACVGLVWWQQRLCFYRTKYEAEEAKAKLAAIVESSEDAIISKNLDGIITSWNESAERIFGYSAAVAIGIPITILIPPEHPNEYPQLTERIKRGEVIKHYATDRIRKNGERIQMSLSLSPVKDEAGAIVEISVIGHNITERKNKEELILSLIEQQRVILDASPAMIFYKDKENRFIRVNETFARVNGLSKEEIEGKTVWELYPKELAEHYWQDDKEVMATNKPVLNIIEELKTPQGTIWVQTDKIPYRNLKGEVIGIIGFTLDITERKAIEAQVKRLLADLERSNKELEQFAAVASHDLQEPLRMVSSYTQLLAERYEGQLDDKAKKYITYAVDGAIRMQTLVNDLLVYSRVGGRSRPLEFTDSHSALGEAIRNLTVTIKEKRAVITNDNLPTVRAYASQLVLVFQNLLANAIKFRGKDIPRIHVSARDQSREWLFSVKDNGIGIEPQHAERVFVIFQRLHTREEYPGTGIGLAVCKRIVERHGGKIWFESEPGNGTTFFFTVSK